MNSSIKAILAALLLIPVLTLGQQLNPTPDACCDCLIIMHAEDPESSGSEDKGPLIEDSPFVFDDEGIASVKVVVKHKGGSGCTKSLKITLGARSVDGSHVHPTTLNLTVAVGQTSAPQEFLFTKEQFRLNSQWEIFLSCDEGTSNTTTSGECSETYPVNFHGDGDCGSCSECKFSGETSPGEGGDLFIPTSPSNGGTGGGCRFSPGGLEQGTELSNPGISGITPIVPRNFTVNRDSGGKVTSIQTGNGTVEIAPSQDETLLASDPKAFVVTHKNASGTIFRTTTFSLKQEGTIKYFRVDSEFDGAITRLQQYKTNAATRVLQKGRVIAGNFVPLQQTTYVRNGLSDTSRAYRVIVEERPVADSLWHKVSDVSTTWTLTAYGWKKAIEVIDPDGQALTSTWSYYPFGETPGSTNYNVYAAFSAGKLKRYTRYDGYEAFYAYSLHQTMVTMPYRDNPSGKVVTTTWDPGTQTRTTTTKVEGMVIKQQSSVHTENSLSMPRSSSSESSSQRISTFKPSGSDFGGRPVRTLNEDGTLTTYSYTRHSGGGYTTVTDTGDSSNGTSVSKGTRTTTTVNSRGTTILRKTEAIGYGTGNAVFDCMAVTSVDAIGRALVTAYYPESVTITGEVAAVTNPKWTTTSEYSCCGLASQTDKYGVKTFYAYDGLQRRIKSNTLGVTTETQYHGLTVETRRYAETVSASLSPALSGDNSTLISKSVRNLSGTSQESWSPDPTSADNGVLVRSSSTVTTFKPAAGLSTRTITTTADNFSQTTDSFLDGRTAKTYGDLSPTIEYFYGVNTVGEITSQTYLDGNERRETTITQLDWAGRTVLTGTPTQSEYVAGIAASATTGGTGSALLAPPEHGDFIRYFYDSADRVIKTIDSDGVVTLMDHNDLGEQTLTAIDLNQNDNIDYGIDTVQFSETTPALDASNKPVWKTITKIWQPGDTSPSGGTIVSTSMQSANGLSSASQTIGVANPSTSVTTLGVNGNWTTTNTAPDGTKSVTTYTNGRMVSMASLASDNSVIESQSQGYDSLNRPVTSTHSRTGTTTTTYLSNTADVVASVTDADNRVTAITYDVRGRQISVNAPDTLDANNNTLANVTNTIYNPDNTVAETTGDQTYRTTHTYDYADRQISMTTYGTETATTTWTYSSDRGLLTRKQYADGKGTDYTYTAAGRLATRAWARGVTTTYTYDSGGRLVLTNYSDSTPDVAITYDALGRKTSESSLQSSVSQSSVSYSYNPGNLQIDTETITYDFNADNTVDFARVIDRSQDTLGRESGWQLKAGTTVENSASYGFSTLHGRLTSVTGPNNDAHVYGYLPNSNLISTVTNTSHVVTNVWEANRNVLLSKENKVGSTVISKYEYSVNDFGQRTDVSQTGTAFAANRSIAWGYNSKGEVVKADHSDTAQSRAYQYDGIGNRLKSADSLTLPGTNNYTPNALNQYTAIEAINPAYDDDGNATAYPLPANLAANSTLVWDGENRLIEVQQAGTSVPLVRYAYDSQSRRITETVGSNSTVYVYDGWNPIAEYSFSSLSALSSTLSKTYLWGMDLSGSMQGAGGVGGLLSVSLLSSVSESSVFFPTYDGNGNVSEYLDTAGNITAHYEYDPFGKTTVAGGSKASDFTHRFSTKPLDSVTKLYYYGYRWYDPASGRWPSRDPIGEAGGENLYGFVGNNALKRVDILGLKDDPASGGFFGSIKYIVEAQYNNLTSGVAFINDGVVNTLVSVPQGFLWVGDQMQHLARFDFASLGSSGANGEVVDALEDIKNPYGNQGYYDPSGTPAYVRDNAANALMVVYTFRMPTCPKTHVYAVVKTETQLSVSDKLARYLLNKEHPVGGHKAKWFEEALGYTQDNADDLARQLTFDSTKVVESIITEYGTKMNQIIDVAGANGRTIKVKITWIRTEDGVVRMVTAVPGD